MKNFFRGFIGLLTGKCLHTSVKNGNCKYCPDCGKKIELKWVCVKCNFCGHYRKPKLNWQDKILPEKKYCFFCGADKWSCQNYYESNIPDRMKSISIKKIDFIEEKNTFCTLTGKTRIWVSKSGER